MFKGSGFYVNDYAKGSGNGGSKKSESDSTPSGNSAAKSDSKTADAKPASTSSDKPKTD